MVFKIKLGAKPTDTGAARQVIHALERIGFRNPLNERELVYGGVKVELWAASENRLRISSFDAMRQRVGNGTQGLLLLTAFADLYACELELDAIPYGGRDEMSEKRLRAWYADRGDFLPEVDSESAMVRMPVPAGKHPGVFYGVASPVGPALTDEVLYALGVEVARAADGGFAFRADKDALRALLPHTADFTLQSLSFRSDDAEKQSISDMTYARRMAELSCVLWRIEKGEGDAHALQRRQTEILHCAKASTTAILKRASASHTPDAAPSP
ncbi:hypothetical protein [Cupriavidus sp. TMH.W2]|uniref:hypothetical protein n=1 Tax=Cupriavidus sp. TMH.W2 TaxID=3434465 RepID=UPI003D76E153